MDLKEIRREAVDWIHLAQDTVQCWALVNTIMNLRIHKMHSTSWIAERL
jgi:hypothetical protein